MNLLCDVTSKPEILRCCEEILHRVGSSGAGLVDGKDRQPGALHASRGLAAENQPLVGH